MYEVTIIICFVRLNLLIVVRINLKIKKKKTFKFQRFQYLFFGYPEKVPKEETISYFFVFSFLQILMSVFFISFNIQWQKYDIRKPDYVRQPKKGQN